MTNIIMDNQSAKREDVRESSGRDGGNDKPLRSREISRPKPVSFVKDDSDGVYIDMKCPDCRKQLSYMNRQVREPLVCPMCSTNLDIMKV